jgi:hypothetical protein
MSVSNNAPAAADDFIPAPAGNALANDAAPVTNALTEVAPSLPSVTREGIGQTALILAAAAVIVLAGLLVLLRNAIRRSLIAGRSTMDSANAAAWAWYFVLLLFGALVVAGIAGHLFDSMAFIGITAAVLVLGVIFSVMMTSRARRSA